MRGNLEIPNSRIKDKDFSRRYARGLGKEDEVLGANSPRAECTVAFPGFQRDKSNTVFFTRRIADRKWPIPRECSMERISPLFRIRIINHVQYEQAKRGYSLG